MIVLNRGRQVRNKQPMIGRVALTLVIIMGGLVAQQPTKATILKSVRGFGLSDNIALLAVQENISQQTLQTLGGLSKARFGDDFFTAVISRHVALDADEIADLIDLKRSGFDESLIIMTLPAGEAQAAATIAGSGDKPVVLVMNFENKTRLQNVSLGPGIADMMTTSLLQSGRFRVVERGEAFSRILAEQDLGMLGVVSSSSAAKVGEILGASHVLTGKVTEFGIRKTSAQIGFAFGGGGKKKITARVVLDVRLVDVSTAEAISAASAVGEISTTVSAGFVMPMTMEVGTLGFDETTIGQATRQAVEKIMVTISK